MRFLQFAFVCLFIFGCGSSEPKVIENPTTCTVTQVPEGLFFRCVDKDGKESSGMVKHGERGAPGETGPEGKAGQGLKLEESVRCSGYVEGGMEGTYYGVNFHYNRFETGSVFVSSTTTLRRGEENINTRSASAFFVDPAAISTLSDGVFEMSFKGKSVSLKSKSGEVSEIPCGVI
jgi:hypothetical protein